MGEVRAYSAGVPTPAATHALRPLDDAGPRDELDRALYADSFPPHRSHRLWPLLGSQHWRERWSV